LFAVALLVFIRFYATGDIKSIFFGVCCIKQLEFDDAIKLVLRLDGHQWVENKVRWKCVNLSQVLVFLLVACKHFVFLDYGCIHVLVFDDVLVLCAYFANINQFEQPRLSHNLIVVELEVKHLIIFLNFWLVWIQTETGELHHLWIAILVDNVQVRRWIDAHPLDHWVCFCWVCEIQYITVLYLSFLSFYGVIFQSFLFLFVVWWIFVIWILSFLLANLFRFFNLFFGLRLFYSFIGLDMEISISKIKIKNTIIF